MSCMGVSAGSGIMKESTATMAEVHKQNTINPSEVCRLHVAVYQTRCVGVMLDMHLQGVLQKVCTAERQSFAFTAAELTFSICAAG